MFSKSYFRPIKLTPDIRDQLRSSNRKRLQILAGIMILVHLLHVIFFYLNQVSATNPATALWRLQIIWLHLIMAIFATGASFLLRLKHRAQLHSFIIYLAACVYQVFAVLVAVVDQQVTTSITPYLIGNIGIAILFYLPPLFSVFLFVGGAVLFSVAAGLYQPSPEILLSLRVNSITFAGLATGLNIVMFYFRIGALRQHKMIRLQRNSLLRRNHELLKLQRYQEKMYSIIGHDLRGPIGLSIEFLRLADKTAGEEAVHYRQTAIASLTGSYSLLQNLVSLSRDPEKADVKSIADTRKIIEDVIHLYAPLAQKNNIIFKISGEFQPVLFPPESLSLVLRNLIHNALKFSDRNSDLKIEGSYDGDISSIRIIDRGPGLPENATENFWQGKALTEQPVAKSGAGLGLNLVRDRLLRHHGNLAIEPNKEGGSVFTVALQTSKDSHK